jgi:protein tyrosine phosphatase
MRALKVEAILSRGSWDTLLVKMGSSLSAQRHTASVNMSDKYREVFRILAEREHKRARYAVPTPPVEDGPQRELYSVANSFKYQAMNRYSNILSYDKTSVKVKGKGYINANIVVGRNGHWWVAAQVSSSLRQPR